VRYPDFKHKETQEALWLDGKFKPSWVDAELAGLPPGSLQSNVFSWNSMLARSVKAGQNDKAIRLFQQMQQEGIVPNGFSFVQVLKACASLQALEKGRCVHQQIIKSGCESDVFVSNSLVDMYAKCGSIWDAQIVFNRMCKHTVVSWSTMILGHVKCGQGKEALELYRQMQLEGIKPDPVTFVGILKACTSVAGLEEGKCVHEQIIQSGCGSDVSVANTLIDMYMKCGSIDNAQNVFDNMPTRDVISWNVMLLGYLKCGQGQKALALSRQMRQDGVQPDAVTFIGFLNVCASAVALEEGKHIHKQIMQSQYKSDVFVGSSLIDMYGKCGSIEDAEKVFNRMPTRNVVAWSAMIQAHVKCGQGQKALALSQQMQRGGVEPDPAVFVAVLNACAILAALEEGRHIEEQIIQRGYQSDVFVIASLLDMYAKCGSIVDAQQVFNSMPTQHVVCWTAMLGCYAMHGHAKEALGHFERMCEEGIQKNDITFVSLLSACSHAGLVDEGLHYFESMSSVYSISATLEHYTCMVGLLGRAGYMHEAKNLINTMSCESDSSVWRALLGACRVHGDLEMGEYIAKKCFELIP
jgi:pentatricopeptide repeat protein